MFQNCNALLLSVDKDWLKAVDDMVRQIGFRDVHRFFSARFMGKKRQGSIPFLFIHQEIEQETADRVIFETRGHLDRDIRFMPVILMTTNTTESVIRKYLTKGFDDIVSFPCMPEALAARLRQQIEQPLDYYQTQSYFGPDRRRNQVLEKNDGRRGGSMTYRHFVIQRQPGWGTYVLKAETYETKNPTANSSIA